MRRTLSNLLMKELTQISNMLDSIKIDASKKANKTQDEIEFYTFMTNLLESSVSKIQQKLNKEKQTNKKFKFMIVE